MPPLPWPRTWSFSKSEHENEAADVAAEVLVVAVVGGRGRGKRGRWSECSGIGRRRLSWRRSLTSAIMEIQRWMDRWVDRLGRE